MITDINYYIEDLYELAKYDSRFDEKILTQIKKQIKPDSTLFEVHQLFNSIKTIQTILRILINYDFLILEFKTADIPMFGIADNSKHFNSKIKTLLNTLKKSLELFIILDDKKAIKQTSKIISIFEEFQANPKELIKKLQFFQLLERAFSSDVRDSFIHILVHNPFSDRDIKEYKDISYYLAILSLLDGYDTTEVQLTTSTLIKIHKIPELKSASYTLKSLFNKLGFKQEIKLNRLDNVHVKTFYRGIAVFDYMTKDEDEKINKYFLDSMDKFRILTIFDANANNSHITETIINEKISEINDKLINQLLEF